MKKYSHPSSAITCAATLFFMVRSLVRQRLAQGKRLDPSAWLHIETLVYIRDHAKPSMQDVAEYLSITAPSASSLIGTMVKGGLVRATTDLRDQRVRRLALTTKGKQRLAAAIERGTDIFNTLFASLTPAELAAFTRALGRIHDKSGK